MKNLQLDNMILNLRFLNLNERIDKRIKNISKRKTKKFNFVKVLTIASISLFIVSYTMTPSYADTYEVEQGMKR